MNALDPWIAASLGETLGTAFAAIAALGALGAIWQARQTHRENAADRREERAERRAQFEDEIADRQRMRDDELRARQLEQLGRISELVAVVRETARKEAGQNGSLQHGFAQVQAPADRAVFYWNARKQLELGLAALDALGCTVELEACRDLATGSTMNYLQPVVSRATDAFDELAWAAAAVK